MDHKDRIKVITELVEPIKNPAFWGKEINHLKALELEGFDSIDFWKTVDKRVKSLAFFYYDDFYFLKTKRKLYLKETEELEFNKFLEKYYPYEKQK